MNKSLVLDIKEELIRILDQGLEDFYLRYRKTEIFIGEAKSVDMITLFLSKECKNIFEGMHEYEIKDLIERILDTIEDHSSFKECFDENYTPKQ